MSDKINLDDFHLVLPAGDRLRKIRESKGLTQEQLATTAKLNLRQYQRYESGERSIMQASLLTCAKISVALGIQVDDLL